MSAVNRVVGLSQNKHNIYRFRIKLPLSIRKYFRRTEINKTLDTREPIEANTKASILYNAYQELLKVIKMGLLSDEQIQELVDKFIFDSLKQDKIDRSINRFGTVYQAPNLDAYDGDYAKAMKANVYGFWSEYKKELAECDYSSMLNVAKSMLDSLGITFDENEETHQVFLQSLMRGHIEILEEAMNRWGGNFNPKYDVVTEVKHEIKNKRVYKTYQDALDLFKKHYDSQSTTDQVKQDTYSVLNRLLIIVGADKNIEDTDYEDLLEIKNTIEKLPKQNKAPYNTMTFKEILEVTDIPNSLIISDSRVKDYIKHIKKFFNFCERHKIISFNPSIDLTKEVESNKKERFTDDEMSDLITVIDKLDDNLKLLFYCYIYSGMRREELYNCEIVDSKVPYFNIKKGKNNSSIRKIPLHKKLLELGLTNDKLIKARSSISFHTLGKKFNSNIKTQVVNTSKKTLHSLRHTIATKLQELETNDNVIRDILGHSSRDTLNRVYATDKTSLMRLKEAIDKIDYSV